MTKAGSTFLLCWTVFRDEPAHEHVIELRGIIAACSALDGQGRH
jgi:hypothetical protein